MIASISPATLADLRRKGEKVTRVDVHTAAEFGEVHVDFAHDIPLDRLDLKAVRAVAIGAELAAFVGCGLVFAGITDTCGMAMLIARNSWNQVSGVCCRTVTSCSRAILLGLAIGAVSGTAIAEHTKDSLDVVKQAIAQQKAVLVDVREPDEWQEGHLAGAGLLPLSAIERGVNPQEIAKVLPKDRIIYCYCLAGGRCMEAAEILKPLGYDVRALKPGYPQLVKAGFPAVVGK
jgi:rhodanese-related sulfurtransferase